MTTTTELLRALRDAGLNQSEIAERTGITQSKLSRWEAGRTPAGADDALRLLRLCNELAGAHPPAAQVVHGMTRAGEKR